jgi:hypothetical protein
MAARAAINVLEKKRRVGPAPQTQKLPENAAKTGIPLRQILSRAP